VHCVVGVVGTLAKLTKAITLRITTNKLYFILSERLINGGVGIWCEMLQVSRQLASTVFMFTVMPCYCYCLYNALHSSIVQIIKLLGPIACRMSGVVCPAVGVVTINHAHLLDRPLLVCLSVRLFQNG